MPGAAITSSRLGHGHSCTPQPLVDKLARAGNEALKSEDVIKSVGAKIMAAIGGSPEDFRLYIEKENKRWTKVVQSAGLKK